MAEATSHAEPADSEKVKGVVVETFTADALTEPKPAGVTPLHLNNIKDPSLLRPNSVCSEKSVTSKNTGGKVEESSTTGIILIGMDTDAATTVSRRSSSVTDQRRQSETNDTDRDEIENINININMKKAESTPSSRPSTSNSLTDDDLPTVPVKLGVPRRSNSSTSNRSSTATSLHRRTPSVDSTKPNPQTTRPRQASSVDPPVTTPTTITSIPPSRRPSATEFQKFRDQLRSAPSNPAFQSIHPDWQLHPNPHHPGTQTEILRIERIYTPVELPSKSRVSEITNYDVMIPRFSPAYPPILRDYGIGEVEWTGFIQRVNKSCMEAFDPFRWSNIALNIVAMLSFWLSEWIMPNITKRVQSLSVCLI